MIQRRIFPALAAAFLVWMLLAIALPIEMARAQNPTPAPTPTLTLTEDCVVNGINQCGERVVREYGLWVFLGVLVLVGVMVVIGRALLKGPTQVLEQASVNAAKRATDRNDPTTAYLRAVMDDYRHFRFRGLDTRANNIAPPELDQAFISLQLAPETEPDARLRPDKGAAEFARNVMREHAEPIDLAHALEHSPRLAIVGAAGSGKSTGLQWAGLAVARARIEPNALKDEPRAFVTTVQHKLIPILLPLRAFNDHCAERKQKRTAAALLAFCAEYIAEKHPSLDLPADYFEKHLRGNGMLVMFDGVDEVALDDRTAVRAAMEDFVREFSANARNRYLVTSRERAYEGIARVAGFRVCEVQNLEETQRDTLITSWCRAVYPSPDEAAASARDLIRRLNTADERVRALAVTPLMTTIFALVHYDRNKELPKQRAELYEHAVHILLTETSYKDTPAPSDWQQRRDYLAAIAFEMHAQKLDELLEEELIDVCWHAFGSDEKSARKTARAFLSAVADRGGLLEEENGKYGFFTHRTFREFLAGRYLAEEKSEREQRAFLGTRLGDDQWVEPTLLAAGYLAIDGKRRANEFVMRLAALGETDTERAYALTWAGLALADLPTDRIFPETHARVSQALLEFFQANPPRVEPRLRRPLGLALGAVGDPRFMRAQIVIGSGAGWRFPALITIPAGEFLMGTSDAEADALQKQNAGTWDDEKPQRRVYVSEFEIGKYPITNQDFRAFWHADGYEDETLWSADGWKWRKGKLDADLSVYSKDYQETVKYWLDGRPVEKRGEPFFWRDPQWNAPNLPVVGVTWFEAEAFCKWLTRMSNQGNKGTGKQVIWRLPTEAEWEKAARGPQNYLWSWGNEWDANKCNSEASKFNATSPVGMYPDGTWKDEKGNVGPLDMMGNVWEWCGDWWQGDLYETRANELVKDPRGPASGNVRVVRGGSWNNARRYCRAAYRYGDVPVGFYDYLGFRVVVVPLPRS